VSLLRRARYVEFIYQNLLQQAINVHDKESDLVLIKSDADGIKSALLGGIAFLGREFDESGAQSKAGRGYSPADLSEWAGSSAAPLS
jgi:hypothetical protein